MTCDLDSLTLSSFRELGRHNAETVMLTRLYVVVGAESLDLDDSLHDFFVNRYETARALVRLVIERERDAGNFRADLDVEQIAREVIAVLMGLEFQWQADPERVDLAEAMEAPPSSLTIQYPFSLVLRSRPTTSVMEMPRPRREPAHRVSPNR